ncbi:MAG: hypothetical protein GX593_13970, partial [Actinomycetales bacterium]|nr:hypothetical protein [Actinomycetales bacterium]
PDTVRFVVVTLVVVGHFVESFAQPGDAVDAFLTSTWALRVPLLVVTAGYFSSAALPTERSVRRMLQSVVLVYVIFDVAQRVQILALTGDLNRELARPVFGMWFLASLVTWRVLLPYLVRVRWFGAIAVLASLGVGFAGGIGYAMSLSRTIVFLPFFLLGWWVRERGLRALLVTARVRWAAAMVLAGGLAAGVLARDAVSLRLLRGAQAYEYAERLEMLGWRAASLGVGAAMVLAVLSLVPRRRVPLVTWLGSGSMYSYLLHQPIHRQTFHAGLASHVTTPGGVVLLAVGAVALSAALASAPVRALTRPLVQPRWAWWWRDAAPSRGRDAS